MNLPEILKVLVNQEGYSQASLAQMFKVDPSTISRWMVNESAPRLRTERLIRHVAAREGILSSPTSKPDEHMRKCFDAALRELRECFHRRGRISSRNELLEELGQILFCQLAAIKHGDDDLLSLRNSKTKRGIAARFIERCEALLEKHYPRTLQSEIDQREISIRIRSSEDDLVVDVLAALQLVDWSQSETALSVDIYNELFGKFLADSFAQEKQLGQYLTPIEMVRMMVDIALAKLSDEAIEILHHPTKCVEFGHILDPSCGVGTFLTELIRNLHPKVIETHGDKRAEIWLRNFTSRVLVGIDKSDRMIKLAAANLTLAGGTNLQLHCVNSLSRTGESGAITNKLNGVVGLILTNPPFGAEFSGNDLDGYKLAQEWASKVPRSIDSELLFLERYVDWLRDEGSCHTVVPDSILTNRKLFQDLRSALLGMVQVNSVISFPPETFAVAGTTVKTSILSFSKPKTSPHQKTYFAICNDIGYKVVTKGTHRVRQATSAGDVGTIVDAYLQDKEAPNCRWEHLTRQTRRWDANYHASLPSELIARFQNPRNGDVRLTDVVDVVNDRVDPRRKSGNFQYIEISDVDSATSTVRSKSIATNAAPSRARKGVRAGDVLVSTVRPEQRKIGIVDQYEDGAVCSTGFAVLRPKQVDSLLLAEVLKSDFVVRQFLRNNVGIAYPAIEESCLHEIVLPICAEKLTSLSKLSSEIRDLQCKVNEKRKTMKGIVDKALSAGSE